MPDDTERIVGKFQDLMQRSNDLFDRFKFVPPNNPFSNRTIWCNGIEIPLDLPKDEFLARLKAAHSPPEPRQQT